MPYEPVIGMEVHIELNTASKMFCTCSPDIFGAPPNTHVCPVCLGMPGTLPVINEQAVRYTILAGLALNCVTQAHNVFARKNYFYPDLPKGYQISQYELPLCLDGYLDMIIDGDPRRVRIRRIHLEEDTGKLTHIEAASLVDFNRAGVPLMEIVSEADLRSADEAYAYVSHLRQIVRYLGVSTGDMEKGVMRCEVNLSMRPVGSETFGTKVEIKNLNSFRAVRNAIEYEVKRQTELLENGQTIAQVTMGWDETAGVTREQRSKEEAHDYRYFPEPDLPPLDLDNAFVADARKSLPELPGAKRSRFIADFELGAYDADLLVDDRLVADYFEQAVAAAEANVSPKMIANWMIGELFRLMKETGTSVHEVKVTPEQLVSLITFIADNTINQNAAKKALSVMWETGGTAGQIIDELGLRQISDADQLTLIVERVISENPDAVQQIQSGKEATMGFLIGQVMRETRGKANPKLVRQLFEERM
jgi:aspartyl-tRNA(Asn)/glutamyl-tRNA(Gln) amidotransferase subunit B